LGFDRPAGAPQPLHRELRPLDHLSIGPKWPQFREIVMKQQEATGPQPTECRRNFGHHGLEPVVAIQEDQVVRLARQAAVSGSLTSLMSTLRSRASAPGG
jgi:hypothetical protein